MGSPDEPGGILLQAEADPNQRAAPLSESTCLSTLPCPSTFSRVETDTPHGRAVFSTRRIPPGTLLGVYPGKHRSIDEFNTRGEYIIPALRYAYYLSHSTVIDPCDEYGEVPDTAELRLALVNEPPPGLEINVAALSSGQQVWFTSVREISLGEELLTCYGSNYPRDYLSHASALGGREGLSTTAIRNLEHVARVYPWLQNGVKSLLRD